MAPLRPLLFYRAVSWAAQSRCWNSTTHTFLGDSEDYLRGLLDSFDQRPLNVEQTDEGRG